MSKDEEFAASLSTFISAEPLWLIFSYVWLEFPASQFVTNCVFFCCALLRRLSCHLLYNSPLACWIQQLALGLLPFKSPNPVPPASPSIFSSTFRYLSNSLSHLVLHCCTFSSLSTPCCIDICFCRAANQSNQLVPSLYWCFVFFFSLCWLKSKPMVSRLNAKVRSCK